jgi:chromosome segregation ATPase
MDEARVRAAVEKLRSELETSGRKAAELRERLRELEAAEPKSFTDIWRTRDRLAYWEGRQEGLNLALTELETRR